MTRHLRSTDPRSGIGRPPRWRVALYLVRQFVAGYLVGLILAGILEAAVRRWGPPYFGVDLDSDLRLRIRPLTRAEHDAAIALERELRDGDPLAISY